MHHTGWHRKKHFDSASLKALGMCPILWSGLSEYVHEDDAVEIARTTEVSTYVLLTTLYKPSEAPMGIISIHIN